jgi:dienelactone hydrolase
MSDADALSQYQKFDFHAESWTFPVYRRGGGPAVIIIHEVPGLHPQVVRFADRVAEAGMTVFLPSLFGEAGRPVTTGYTLGVVARLCVRREFTMWRTGQSSPVVAWLRALARHAHQECGGRGVGAVGMCLTGGFALAMMTEPSVVAPVLSQPSMPVGPGRGGCIDASPSEIACARQRFSQENLSLLGLRFKSDRLVPDARFQTYRREFGEHFEAIELDDADAKVNGQPPHSVLTLHLREDGPTKAAEQRVITFFRERTTA